MIVALLTTPRGGTSRPMPSGWYRGPGNRLADALRARGAEVLPWWDEPVGPALTDDIAVAAVATLGPDGPVVFEANPAPASLLLDRARA